MQFSNENMYTLPGALGLDKNMILRGSIDKGDISREPYNHCINVEGKDFVPKLRG